MVLKIACMMMCLLGMIQSLHAQEDELQAVDDASVDITAILGGREKGINKVRVISDSEQSLSIEVSFKGLDEKSKISGAILNKMKKPLKEVVTEPRILSKSEGTVELKFQFKQGSAGYNKSFVESQFVFLSISRSDSLLDNLDLGGENILGDNYLYKLEKKWRVSGSEQIVIDVKLTPFKSASSISP